MNSKVLITVRNENGALDSKIECDDYRQFRLLCFDKEGYPCIYGNLPLKDIREPFREWLKHWVAQQDILQVEDYLDRYVTGFKPEKLMSAIEDIKNEFSTLLKKVPSKRDKIVAFHMIWELLKTIAVKLQQSKKGNVTVRVKPTTNGQRRSLYRAMWDRLFREEDENGE